MIRRFELAAGLLWFLAAPLLAGKPKEVVARWEELAPLVEKREIETVLANGVHLRGRVEKVLPEALEVRVKRTSDPSLVPKGRTRVPRELVSDITVRWRQGPARALLPLAGFFCSTFVLPWILQRPDGRELRPAEGWAIFSGTIAIGYLAGRKIDTKSIRLLVLRDSDPQSIPAVVEPNHGRLPEP